MNLKQSNPFAAGRLIIDSAGIRVLEREPYRYKPSAGDYYHELREGDTLGKLAHLYFGNIVPEPERYWHVIADANQIENGLALGISPAWGTTLVIPDISEYLIMIEA